MSYKTILVSVDASTTTARTLGVALELADRFDGHLIGLHVRPRFQVPAFTDGTFAMDALYKAHDDKVRSDEAAATSIFKKAIGTRGSEWRVIDGFVEDELAIAARYVDLVVAGQADVNAPSAMVPTDLAEQVALTTERPVLVVPHTGPTKPPGKTVLLC